MKKSYKQKTKKAGAIRDKKQRSSMPRNRRSLMCGKKKALGQHLNRGLRTRGRALRRGSHGAPWRKKKELSLDKTSSAEASKKWQRKGEKETILTSSGGGRIIHSANPQRHGSTARKSPLDVGRRAWRLQGHQDRRGGGRRKK